MNQTGKARSSNLNNFHRVYCKCMYITNLTFWLYEKHMVENKVPSFISLVSLWVLHKCIYLSTYLNTQQKLKSFYLIWIYPCHFLFHIFCTCNMHYRIEQHGGKDKSMYPQIVRSSQDFAVFMTMPFVLY